MKKKRPVWEDAPEKRFPGIFDPDAPDLELDGTVVSSTEMTGAIPATRREPTDDSIPDNYYF